MRVEFKQRSYAVWVGLLAVSWIFLTSRPVLAGNLNLDEPIFPTPTAEAGDSEIPAETNYIAQTYPTSCGQAVLAMTIADKTKLNVKQLNKEILEYFGNRSADFRLGSGAMIDYLNKFYNFEVVAKFHPGEWTVDDFSQELEQNESMIVDVTSRYGEVTSKNRPNHWVIADEIIEIQGKKYVVVRDSLRQADAISQSRKLSSFMTAWTNGSILIPVEKFVPALGGNRIFFNRPKSSDSETRHN